MIGPWQQELFILVVQLVGSAMPLPEGFLQDRAPMFEGGLDVARIFREQPAKRDQLRAKLDLFEWLLSDGRDFVLGSLPSLADFALFHPLFALRAVPAAAPVLEPFARIGAWLGRLDAFGHGERTDIEGAEAIAIARRSAPRADALADPADPNGRRPGDRVEIVHENFGRDPVVGELVASAVHEIAIRRHDERAGDVVVHFPREHYIVLPA